MNIATGRAKAAQSDAFSHRATTEEQRNKKIRRYLTIVLVTAFFAGYIPPAGLFYAAKYFGASWTLSQLAEFQAKNPDAVFLPFDLRYNSEFKMDRIAATRPEVIVISTSRAGTLREQMFKPYHFYNMSFTAWTTDQLADAFDRATRIASPRVVIISLDYFLFTNDWERGYSGTRTMIYDQPWTYLRSSILDFAHTAYKHPQVYKDYLEKPSNFIGTQAIYAQEGYRADGSYIYSSGHINDAREHYQTAASLVNSMPGAPEMSERQKAPIARIAELARQRGIRLVGLQLPFISAGVKFLDEDESYRHYAGVWREFESDHTKDWLKSLGILFLISEDPQSATTARISSTPITQPNWARPESCRSSSVHPNSAPFSEDRTDRDRRASRSPQVEVKAANRRSSSRFYPASNLIR